MPSEGWFLERDLRRGPVAIVLMAGGSKGTRQAAGRNSVDLFEFAREMRLVTEANGLCDLAQLGAIADQFARLRDTQLSDIGLRRKASSTVEHPYEMTPVEPDMAGKRVGADSVHISLVDEFAGGSDSGHAAVGDTARNERTILHHLVQGRFDSRIGGRRGQHIDECLGRCATAQYVGSEERESAVAIRARQAIRDEASGWIEDLILDQLVQAAAAMHFKRIEEKHIACLGRIAPSERP